MERNPPEVHQAAVKKFRMHWHVVFTHFPTTAFAGAFLFMALHAVTGIACLSFAAYLTLVAGSALLLPTTATGWMAWRKRYHASALPLFRYKIRIAIAMIVLSAGLVLYQTVYPFAQLDVLHRWAHAVYFTGLTVLMIGGFAEGFWGGRLNHR